MSKETIKLPVYGIIINLNHGTEYTSGTIVAPELYDDDPDEIHSAALDGITSMILAAACAGVDVNTPRFWKPLKPLSMRSRINTPKLT